MKTRHAILIGLALIATALFVPQEIAAHDENSPRHVAMTTLGDTMQAIGKRLKAGHLGSELIASADKIVTISKSIPDYFSEPEKSNKSRARPEIWADFSSFRKASDRLVFAAMELKKTLSANDLEIAQAALKQTGETCGACHKAYRIPKR